MAINYELTNSIINREAQFCGRSMGFKFVEAKFDFSFIHNSYSFFILVDNSKYYKCAMDANDLQMSLDDFSRKYIIPALKEIQNNEIQYDDAGQII